MGTVDTMPASANPTSNIDSDWAQQEKQIRQKYQDFGKTHGYGDNYGDIHSPFANVEVQQEKEKFMQGRFQSAQQQSINNQRNLAQQFRQGLPGYENSIYDQINANAKYAIANQQNQIKKSANQRGLLYSGLRTGSENAAASDIASQAAEQKSKVAPQLEDQANQLDQRAIETAQAKQVSDLNLANNVFDRALQDAQARMAATGQMMSAAGQLGGTVAGNYFNKKGTK